MDVSSMWKSVKTKVAEETVADAVAVEDVVKVAVVAEEALVATLSQEAKDVQVEKATLETGATDDAVKDHPLNQTAGNAEAARMQNLANPTLHVQDVQDVKINY